MQNAPKNTPILAICHHDSNPYYIKDGKSLTTYGAFCEGFHHVEDGPHVIQWGGGYNDDDGRLPDWWFQYSSDFEIPANPIAWIEIPSILEVLLEHSKNHIMTEDEIAAQRASWAKQDVD